jgi:hypothetical protein
MHLSVQGDMPFAKNFKSELTRISICGASKSAGSIAFLRNHRRGEGKESHRICKLQMLESLPIPQSDVNV